ncbi:hypothetical protein AG1IA_02643 [Rhizoctonia solani AG-1 IA]|uniref:Uncharacterized protein n=1 Tax=Thanatephorus cucumeris (strain AG1-IA) TaxID=983506 RepID=L8WZD4_THACA|nr:hypothetical protein AG1IA_02643 [Rhizoctonia solani AG-1 IA]
MQHFKLSRTPELRDCGMIWRVMDHRKYRTLGLEETYTSLRQLFNSHSESEGSRRLPINNISRAKLQTIWSSTAQIVLSLLCPKYRLLVLYISSRPIALGKVALKNLKRVSWHGSSTEQEVARMLVHETIDEIYVSLFLNYNQLHPLHAMLTAFPSIQVALGSTYSFRAANSIWALLVDLWRCTPQARGYFFSPSIGGFRTEALRDKVGSLSRGTFEITPNAYIRVGAYTLLCLFCNLHHLASFLIRYFAYGRLFSARRFGMKIFPLLPPEPFVKFPRLASSLYTVPAWNVDEICYRSVISTMKTNQGVKKNPADDSMRARRASYEAK